MRLPATAGVFTCCLLAILSGCAAPAQAAEPAAASAPANGYADLLAACAALKNAGPAVDRAQVKTPQSA